jgi:hypothetical protein
MKKITLLFLTVLIAVFAVSQVHANTQIATITIDGDKSDWATLTPAVVDAEGNSGCGATGDVKSIYTAIDTTHVYFMIETYGVPIKSANAGVFLFFDFKPGMQLSWGNRVDLIITVSATELSAYQQNAQSGAPESYPIEGEQIAWGNVVEVSIPLSQLGSPTYFEPTSVDIWDNDVFPPPATNNHCNHVEITPPQGMDYMYVQQRNYEDGTTINRLYFSMYEHNQNPPGDLLAEAALYDPNGDLVNISLPTYAPEICSKAIMIPISVSGISIQALTILTMVILQISMEI